MLRLILLLCSGASALHVEEALTFDAINDVQHLALAKDYLYVGATDRVYQLSTLTLDLVSKAVTGPVKDSPHCDMSGFCLTKVKKEWTPSRNMLLLPLVDKNVLITCGSTRQGTCELRRLENVNKVVKGHDDSYKIPVASNAGNASTVGFVGPGVAQRHVLYVGASYTYEYFRDGFPALATRSLDEQNMFGYAYEDEICQEKSNVKLYREYQSVSRFPVTYVGGFTDDRFAYWVTVQRDDLDKPFTTKLGRICQSDRTYQSYSEIELVCIGDLNTPFKIITDFQVTKLGSSILRSSYANMADDELFLVGTFVKSSEATSPSTICAFPIARFKTIFEFNLGQCLKGDKSTFNIPQFGFQGCTHGFGCGGSSSTADCQLFHVGGPPEMKVAIASFDDHLTSVAVDVLGPTTILFAGTSRGEIVKTRIDHNVHQLYHRVSVSPGHAIGADMLSDATHLYIPAGKTIYKLRKENCAQHKDCATCLDSKDPYCGWCSLENKCSVQSSCNHRRLPRGWVPSGTPDGECPAILSVEPRNASVAAAVGTKITVQLKNLPQQNGSYSCVLDHVKMPGVMVKPDTLVCQLGSAARASFVVPEDQDHTAIPLHVHSDLSGVNFVTGQFTFFDCSRRKICLQCLRSKWPCNWCLEDNRCVTAGSKCEEKNPGGGRIGESQCPHIRKTDILVPHGHSVELEVPTSHLDKVMAEGSFLECLLTVGSHEYRVQARVEGGNKVICGSMQYLYDKHVPLQRAKLALVVDRKNNVDEIKVQMYKCNLLGEDCSRCKALPSKYKCDWCGGVCTPDGQCPYGKPDRPTTCPAPVITGIKPARGPAAGGTLVQIQGRDLGTKTSATVIIGQDCRIVDFDIDLGITCETAKNRAGPVAVTVVRNTIESQPFRNFTFVEPRIMTFSPLAGPRSGGTLLRILGRELLSATNITASVGTFPCLVDRENSTATELLCRTTESPQAMVIADIQVKLDNQILTLRQPYTYIDDPLVKRISPEVTFESGGRKLMVSGERFTTVVAPKLYLLSLDGKMLTEPKRCSVLNDTTMLCRTPPLIHRRAPFRRALSSDGEVDLLEPDLSAYEKISLGFEMDDVPHVRNLTDRFQLTMTPDPVYVKFKDGARPYNEGNPLVLDGRHLKLASTPDEVKVFVGSEQCNVTLLAPRKLVCDPPPKKPRSARSLAEEPQVVVKVGNLEFPLGKLVYDAKGGGGSRLSIPLIGGVIAGSVALILICVAVIATWSRRRTSLAEKDYHRIQLELENLESNVRSECKQAFAELQTDMSDLTSDLVPLGAPYHSRARYASRLMFRGDEGMLTMEDWRHTTPYHNGYTNHANAALSQFEHLLSYHNFVLHLVDVLEAEPTFSVQDRIHVASLLTSILARNMEYNTQIIMILLKNLITKSVESKHPQLMLRRTESVVEKMLANWIALCLYDYLHLLPGQNLFLLFKAIKHQTEKGAVDAVTADARYSLSEDRLLKEQITPYTVLVYMIPPNQIEPDEKQTCRVLSCDTISQVKAKMLDAIYRNGPVSQRPPVHDIDLEWRCSDGHFILTDDDRDTPPSKDGWRRLNTLEHYHVPSAAVFAILPRNPKSFTTLTRISDCSNHTYASIGSTSTLLLSRHSPESNVEQSVRYWHLAKPDEVQRHQAHSSDPPSPFRPFREIYLTRLLTTKGTLQNFIDDFFHSALTASCHGQPFPAAIKYLFDFFEEQALAHGITDPSVVHSWKNNSLLLRFWVNVIKNPEFVFDVDKSVTADCCLSVIAQALMDACAQGEAPRLGKDSPSNKLLFARDLPRYRDLVQRFYSDIHAMPRVSEQELAASLTVMSQQYSQEFQVAGAVRQLLDYVIKYDQKILGALDNDVTARQQRLADKLDNVLHQISIQRASQEVTY